MTVGYEALAAPDQTLRIHVKSGLFFLLLGIIFFLRVSDTSYNTIFYDEAVNTTVGREALRYDFSLYATSWTFGSYLYPVLAAAADQVGGLTGLRVLSAVFSTAAACFVFLTTLRLFDNRAALIAMLIFGLTGASIHLGEFGVYDVPAVPLLAMTLYCIVSSALEAQQKAKVYLLVAACIGFSAAVLSKYIGLLYFPALILIGMILYISLRHAILPLFAVFLGATGIILVSYFVINHEALSQVFTHSDVFLTIPNQRIVIIKAVWEEIGPAIVAALIGVLLLPKVPFIRAVPQSRRTSVLLAALLMCLLVTIFAVPIYQIVTKNIQSLWKHTVLSLIFLAPLGGYGLATVIEKVRSYNGPKGIYLQVAGATVMLAGLIWFGNNALDQVWGFQHSWPSSTNAVKFLREQAPFTLKTRILAEQSSIYEYYFDLGAGDRDVWSSTFYMAYGGYLGLDAMTRAVTDQYFDWVILDDYYTAETNRVLEPVLKTAGYSLSYQDPEPQVLSTGQTITTRIYKKRSQ